MAYEIPQFGPWFVLADLWKARRTQMKKTVIFSFLWRSDRHIFFSKNNNNPGFTALNLNPVINKAYKYICDIKNVYL